MKRFISILNAVLIIMVVILFHQTKLSTEHTKTTIDIKKISSSSFRVIDDSKEVEEDILEEQLKEEVEEKKETKVIDIPKKPVVEASVPAPSTPQPSPPPVTDVIETMTGRMSGYGPDCSGCSGFTASGRFVGNGNITVNDSTYGTLRILAGDRSLPFGTIVRVKNTRVGNFIGMVLDRGSGIGIDRAHLFDLLFENQKEAAKFEISNNVTFEILRLGY